MGVSWIFDPRPWGWARTNAYPQSCGELLFLGLGSDLDQWLMVHRADVVVLLGICCRVDHSAGRLILDLRCLLRLRLHGGLVSRLLDCLRKGRLRERDDSADTSHNGRKRDDAMHDEFSFDSSLIARSASGMRTNSQLCLRAEWLRRAYGHAGIKG